MIGEVITMVERCTTVMTKDMVRYIDLGDLGEGGRGFVLMVMTVTVVSHERGSDDGNR